MKVRVYMDERYPDFMLSTNIDDCPPVRLVEIPDELVARYTAVAIEYDEVQELIFQYHHKQHPQPKYI